MHPLATHLTEINSNLIFTLLNVSYTAIYIEHFKEKKVLIKRYFLTTNVNFEPRITKKLHLFTIF